MRNFLVAISVCSVFALNGQSELLKSYSEKYPNVNGVYLNYEEHAEIEINKEGVPVVTETHHSEVLYLNDNYHYYNDESVSYSTFVSLEELKPYVHIPKGDKFKKVAVKNFEEQHSIDRSIFHNDVMKKVFFYDGLTKGGKTELNYVKTINEPHFFGNFHFASHFPVEQSKFTITTPADMEILFTLFGTEKDKVNYEVSVEGKKKIHTWTASNLKKIEFEDDTPSPTYFITHVVVRINTYQFKGETKKVLGNVDDLYEYYHGFIKDVNQDETPVLDAIADSLVAGLNGEDEKTRQIFYWVQDHIKYVAFEDGLGGFIPRDASLVCDRKYGDCKDMASILYKMLNHVGVEAHYTWIGTRSIPYTYEEVPTPKVDNHMICAAKVDGEYVFLDATSDWLPFGTPSAFIQGKQALIALNKEEYLLKMVPIMPQDYSQTIDHLSVSFAHDTVLGEGVVTYTGYSAKFLKNALARRTEKEQIEFFESAFKKGNNKSAVKVIEVNGQENRDVDLTVKYSYKTPDYVRVNGDEIYYNPFLKKYHSDEKLNLEINTLDKEKLFKENNVNVSTIKVPEGYEVSYLPPSTSYENDAFGFELSISHDQTKNEIMVGFEFSSNHLILASQDFNLWNEMIAQLNEAYAELIIFKKSDS